MNLRLLLPQSSQFRAKSLGKRYRLSVAYMQESSTCSSSSSRPHRGDQGPRDPIETRNQRPLSYHRLSSTKRWRNGRYSSPNGKWKFRGLLDRPSPRNWTVNSGVPAKVLTVNFIPYNIPRSIIRYAGSAITKNVNGWKDRPFPIGPCAGYLDAARRLERRPQMTSVICTFVAHAPE